MKASYAAERLAKYEAWLLELESRRTTLRKSRRRYLRFFLFVMFVSPLGWIWHPWIGAGAFITGVLFCAFGFYVVLFRGGEYDHEISQVRREIELLRGDPPASTSTLSTGEPVSR
jgi:hypothetical protein